MALNSNLSQEQTDILKNNGEKYRNWINTDTGRNDLKEHREHESYFKEKLSRENLKKLTNDELSAIWKKSWASNIWGNKDWYVKNKLIDPNGINKIREGLDLLLYGSEDLVTRYDKFRANVSGFGVALISEILNMIFPDKYCLWNDKPKKVLQFLGLNALPANLYKYNTATGQEYLQCVNYLSVIRNQLSQFGIKDFISLDIFFSHLLEEIERYSDKKHNQSIEGFQKTKKPDLENLILTFDKNRNALDSSRISDEEAMKLQSQFISDFPPDKISDMTLDDYAIGKTDPNTGETDYGTFCYRLEFGIQGFGGIRGTPASKFGIYRNKKTQEFVYNKSKFESPETAYHTIKSEILLILHAGKEFTQDKDWMALAQTLEGEFNILRHVRSKILSVYYPNEFLQMHSNSDAERILISLFGLTRGQIPKGLFLKQAKLLELKNAHPVMKNWSNIAYSFFIWDATTPKESDEARTYDEESVWLVRAGRKGEGEQLALERNLVGIGYDGFDWSIKDFKTFKQRFIALHPDQKAGSVNRVIPQIWDFLHNVKIGDFVMLPLLAQNSKLVAVGRIEGDCQYAKLHSELTVSRPVKWLKKDVPKSAFDDNLIKFLGFRGTVYRLGGTTMIQKLRESLKKAGVTEVMFEQNMDSSISKSEQVNARIPFTIEDLAKRTYLPIELLSEVEALLLEKRQIIFYGPPGTSKTYVARKFSEYFTQNSDNVEIIQFHQSYSYEDFVEGIKPSISTTAGIEFSRQSGLFKNIVKRCIEQPTESFVLIIDEINRGNISKIIGELIYLLEYRNESISLTYSPGEKFYIPSNLYIVGTMNSADRSIAFVDYALRRRFYFIDFYPDSDGRILYGWFKDNSIKLDASTIVDMLNQINRKIRDQLGKEYQIGHSYFMVKDLSYNKLKMIIKYAIIPLIEQYYFGKEKSVREIMEICNNVLFPSHSNIDALTSE